MAHRSRAALLVSGLTAVAALVRLPGLDGGLWYDEIVTIVVSIRQPLWQIVTEYPWNNVHPLYSVLGHVASQLFGEHAWSVRLPAVIFGVAGVPLVYLLGAAVATRREALIASAMLAVSYHHVWFSQNARGYSALAFWALLCTWLVVHARRRGGWGVQAAYGVAAALGAYTHLTMGFVIAAHAVSVAAGLVRERRRGLRPPMAPWAFGFGLAAALSALLYGPLLLQVQDFFAAAPASGTQVATQRWALGEALKGLQIGLGAAGLLAAGALSAVGLGSYLRRAPGTAALFIGPGVLTLAGTVVMQRPIFPRFFFFSIGFAVLLAARGAATLAAWIDGRRRQSGGRLLAPVLEPVLVAAVLVPSALSLGGAYGPKQDFAGARQFVEAARGPDEAVLTAGLAAFPYDRYYRASWTVVDDAPTLAAARAGAARAWLVYTFPAYLSAMTPELMRVIEAECRERRRFPGSVGGGDVIVCAFDPTGPGVSR